MNNAKQANQKQPTANKLNDPWADLESDPVVNNKKSAAATNVDEMDDLWGNSAPNKEKQQTKPVF